MSRGTTHISVVDARGNAVALTASTGAGSGIVVPGTGIHLNNMIGEFDLPKPPRWPDGWHLGQPDLVLTFAQPYTLPAEGTDVFRVFVLPIPTDVMRYVRGLEFHPGNPRVVHHANLRIDRTPASRELDETDPLPGYEGRLSTGAQYPDGHFLGWTPGQLAPLVPGTFAWTLRPGADLVVQLHMQPSGAVESVQPKIGFYFSKEPPTRTPASRRQSSSGP